MQYYPGLNTFNAFTIACAYDHAKELNVGYILENKALFL